MPRTTPSLPLWTVALLAASAALLVACGNGSSGKKATQTAVQVNKEDITVHQINLVLQQQRGLKPEQTDAASRQILERLIDQELFVQQANKLKLDRNPQVVQQLEALKRDVLARAYADHLAQQGPKPTAEEVKQYYDANPALFRDRRVYTLAEVSVQATPAQVEQVRTMLAASKGLPEFTTALRNAGLPFAVNPAQRSAEQVSMELLPALAKLQNGQGLVVPVTGGATVVILANSRSEPVSEEQARPAIEQFFNMQNKRKLTEAQLKTLRAEAKIEYKGKFAEAAASAPQAATAASAAAPGAASSALGDTDITKGLGLK